MNQLRRLAQSEPRDAGPQVERDLIAAFRERQPRKLPIWIYAAVAAASLAVVLSFIFFHKRPVPVVYAYEAPGFVALPYAQSGVPLESVVVVRVEIPSSELSSMGVAVPAAASSARLTADLLVGQDGVARAVRLVQ